MTPDTAAGNPMRELYIDKVVVHMGVGESGDKLEKAEAVMQTITGQKPVRTIARKTQPAFGIRKGAPIGCKVTLRGEAAEAFVQTALAINQKRLSASQFDSDGNVSFGIEEHTDFPGMAYDPAIGIFGMDVNMVIERRGIRIARRKIEQKRLPAKQRVKPEEAMAFLKERYQVEVL
ncbi:MAG: 50S ribosomal protein L5 [Methanomicrobiales archaeon]|nr:50S ribosomal protein L5 [Methanomicrobiales archaeon]MDI6875943.1 50S ribosomal protein L5 [Methanomicrobiales archaeon]